MLENPSDTVGRRNRALNRKKSGDRFERINHSFGNEGGKSLVTSSSNIPVVDHGDAGRSNFHNESPQPGLISIDGCCSSQAAQLMSDRWAVAMHAYNDTSIDQSERPAIYSGASSSAWGHSKLPHQFDFLAELRRSVRNANLSTTQGSADHS
ncbi:uncharacterized protein [Aristolochia californica]|uniref:uncharacterized protein isoform X2 n=1 Tax=Aristolochia californica TaxID=171875 RepID=UPI0035DADD6F